MTCRLSELHIGRVFVSCSTSGQLLFCIPREETFLEESLQKDKGHPFSLSLEDSVRVRRDHQGWDCAPHCFISHDSEERDSSDLPGSIANAWTVVVGPSVGRCKWNTESNNNPSVAAAS